MNFKAANQTLIELAEKYQHIIYKDIDVPVPYFINTAEQIYKQTMKEAGIEGEMINKTIKLIKEGKTPLGSGGGKGSPKEIEQDLERLVHYLGEQKYHPNKPVLIRRWMTEMHIGLDCAGYIYNILSVIERLQGENILNKLAWANPEDRKPSHAGAFIFDSENFEEIYDYNDLEPLDIVILKDRTHVGILAEYQGNLCLTECSMGRNGVTFNNLTLEGGAIVVEDCESWTELLRSCGVTVRRMGV